MPRGAAPGERRGGRQRVRSTSTADRAGQSGRRPAAPKTVQPRPCPMAQTALTVRSTPQGIELMPEKEVLDLKPAVT